MDGCGGCGTDTNYVWCVIDRYFELLKDAKIKGYLFEEKNYFNKEK